MSRKVIWHGVSAIEDVDCHGRLIVTLPTGHEELGYAPGSQFFTEDHVLEAEPCSHCLAHPGWAHGDESQRREPADVCRACYGSGCEQ
jgi:hypothetical protein